MLVDEPNESAPVLGSNRRPRSERRSGDEEEPVLRMALPPGTEAGASVDLAVRPESIGLAASPSDGAVPARIVEQSYLGNLSEYHVALASGERLRAQTPALADFSVGGTVHLTVDAEQCNLFLADAGGSGARLT